jgi:hypothetical protein
MIRPKRILVLLLAIGLAISAANCTLEEKRPAPADSAKPTSTDTTRRAPVRALAARDDAPG